MGMTTNPPHKTGICPKCGDSVTYEPCDMFPNIVPLCDACERHQTATWEATERRAKWNRLYHARIPARYAAAAPEKIPPLFSRVLVWMPSHNPGGLGLIGDAGAGKSSALACVLWRLEQPFRWWSGTEARDAAIEAATADKDREGATRRWEAAMRVPILALDDISQGRMTEAWSSKLFDLLETRLSENLPTLWTSQITLADLRTKIIRQNGGDSAQADAISRRLAQHSLVLKPEP